MSNAKQILAMLQSKADGDDEHFYSIALQVAAAEARQGRRTLAEDLRAAVDKAREKAASGQTVAVPFASPRGDLADLIEMRPPRFDLESVVMNASLRARLDDVVLQQHKRDWLREHGKTPSRRVLFVGPPGSGKTMSAEALAGELRLPLFVIRLESLITRFMGETAAKLRLVFDETARHRGVYLFDEFDAVGGNRGATNDVAEMRRVLNSFLQFMEEPNSTDSVIIGATNYPDLLDPALLRRFDLVMEFCPPTDEEIRTIIKFNLRPMKFPNLKWKSILASAQGLSQSEIARATEDAVKSAILAERKNVTSDDLLRRLNDRREMREAFRPSAVNK
jgi:SpoVK/Ycf46/Vps4 family AAA+-type ATPase